MKRSTTAWFAMSCLGVSLAAACSVSNQPLTDGTAGEPDASNTTSSSGALSSSSSGGGSSGTSSGGGSSSSGGNDGGSSGTSSGASSSGGSACGSCPPGSACTAEGQCKDVQDQCPEGPSNFSREYPETWAEGQCILRYRCNNCGGQDNSTIRAHYSQPGNHLYAKRHEVGGGEGFTGADLLGNMQVELREAYEFCLTEPNAEGCQHLQKPDCSSYPNRVCQTLFHWSNDGRPIRLRRTGQTLWCEGQNPQNGSWEFHAGNWIDATGGLPANTAYFCGFAQTRPDGDPEPCP